MVSFGPPLGGVVVFAHECENIIDPNTTTPEGLALGDNLDRVLELYGDNYQVNGAAFDFYGTETMLSIIVQNEAVASIEYRMNTD